MVEGLMFKYKDSLYILGRFKGLWFKWKCDFFLIDVVFMYV